MNEQQNASAKEQVLQVGPDRVTISQTEVIIDAKHRMPEWQVRELNPPPVYFQDQKYYLVEARKGSAPYEVTYLLRPWKSDLGSSSKSFYTYDAEAVRERDSNRRSGHLDEVIRALLMPFYGVLGMFWTGVQNRLVRFGFVPRAITGISIFTVFCLAFGQGVFAVVTINASVRSGKMVLGGMLRSLCNQDSIHLGPISIPFALLDCLLTLAFIADVAMRYTFYLREDEWNGGFLEWLFRRGHDIEARPKSETLPETRSVTSSHH